MSVDDENDKDKDQFEEKSVRKIQIDRGHLERLAWWKAIDLPQEQTVINDAGIPEKVPTPKSKEQHEEPVRRAIVTVRHPGRSAVFYSVTEDEIDNYAQFNFLSSIALTLFGVFAGFSLGCVVALIQGDLSEASTSVFWWLLALTAVVTAVFLGAAIYLYQLGKRTKKAWESSVTDS